MINLQANITPIKQGGKCNIENKSLWKLCNRGMQNKKQNKTEWLERKKERKSHWTNQPHGRWAKKKKEIEIRHNGSNNT